MPFVRIQFRRGTSSEWSSANPILASGEMGIETDTSRFKLGDGITAWNSLSYGGLQGDTGPQGPVGPGLTILGTLGSELELDASYDGNIGDAYIINGDLYIWYGSVWTNVGRFVGPEGPPGEQPFDTFSITKTITLTTDWQDTGIKSTDLTTGTYILQLFANDVGAGGTNSNEYYSGVMSWYAGTTNGTVELPTDEVPLHRAGGGGSSEIYLRTYRSPSGSADNLKLQIYSNIDNASPANYVFKFIRML